MKPRAVRPLYGRKALTTSRDFRGVLRSDRPPRQNVAVNLALIMRVCKRADEPNAARAQRLADDVRDFRKAFKRGSDVASLVNRAMLIGAAFEQLRANVLWSKPARAGLGTMQGGRNKAGVNNSALIAWAKEQIASGAPRRGLAAQAVTQGKTTLTERQALNVLKRADVVPSKKQD